MNEEQTVILNLKVNTDEAIKNINSLIKKLRELRNLQTK